MITSIILTIPSKGCKHTHTQITCGSQCVNISLFKQIQHTLAAHHKAKRKPQEFGTYPSHSFLGRLKKACQALKTEHKNSIHPAPFAVMTIMLKCVFWDTSEFG